jgi:hypothetical protein
MFKKNKYIKRNNVDLKHVHKKSRIRGGGGCDGSGFGTKKITWGLPHLNKSISKLNKK